jgi:hypothetical protein
MFDLLFYSAAMEVHEWARANKGKVTALVVLVMLCWELYVAKDDTDVRPSYVIDVVMRWTKWWWHCVGRGFMGVIDIARDMIGERIGIVAVRICVPTIELLFAWVQFFMGMESYVKEFNMPEGVAWTGIVAGFSVLIFFIQWFRIHHRVFERICDWLPDLELMATDPGAEQTKEANDVVRDTIDGLAIGCSK